MRFWGLCAATAVLFCLSAFFSASETVLFSLTPKSRRRMAAKKSKTAAAIEEWLKDPALPLATILAGNTLVNFALVGTGYLALKEIWPRGAEAATVPLFTILLLVFGEVSPKQYAMRHAEGLAAPCVKMLKFWMVALRPLSKPMVAARRVFGEFLTRERRPLSDHEFKVVVRSAAKNGIIDSDEADMVEGVMRLTELYAVNEMTPRVRMQGLKAELSPGEMAREAREVAHSFLPVYRGSLDCVDGFYDKAAGVVQKPLEVRDSDRLDDVLVAMVKKSQRVALVQDRWGGTAGMITRGDILEVLAEPVGMEARK
ncbi:MAG: DUF21 domain-containing protein [Kiritimatiellae bacterium]|nr:DUF21 domain-containing protein [Kiritimatiellia bacterium]